MSSPENLRPVVNAFVARLDEVVEKSCDAIMQAVPSYKRAGGPLMTDVRRAVAENVRILSGALVQGREARQRELEPIERTGARRAQAGVPLSDVLHAYRTVTRVCWDVLAEECRTASGDPLDAAIALAEAILRYTDQISTTVADAYTREQRAIVREQEGARREFLADLLHGTDARPEEILARAHSFGYDLSLNYVALVGMGGNPDGGNEAAVSAALAGITSAAGADPIVLQNSGYTVALVPAEPFTDPEIMPEKLVAELGLGWRFGIGGPQPGLEGIRRAYFEAREALQIGLALNQEGPVFRFDDLLVYHFLRLEPKVVDRFIEQTIGPLITHDGKRGGELVKTLEAYFAADTSVKVAGEALFAHPHTVTYRLKQVERLTGWSLRHPEDKLRLQLALRAYRLAQARRPDD